jgi:hypothetical protein
LVFGSLNVVAESLTKSFCLFIDFLGSSSVFKSSTAFHASCLFISACITNLLMVCLCFFSAACSLIIFLSILLSTVLITAYNSAGFNLLLNFSPPEFSTINLLLPSLPTNLYKSTENVDYLFSSCPLDSNILASAPMEILLLFIIFLLYFLSCSKI